MSPIMGNKKRSRANSGSLQKKSTKELIIDELCPLSDDERNIISITIPTCNQWSISRAAYLFSLERPVSSTDGPISPGVTLMPDDPESLVEKWLALAQKLQQQSTFPMDSVAKRCLLSAKMAVTLLEGITSVSTKVDLLVTSFEHVTQKYLAKADSVTKSSGPSFGDEAGSANQHKQPTVTLDFGQPAAGVGRANWALQLNQVMLYVCLNNSNRNRWHSRQEIICSLSQLLRCGPQFIDLVATNWLPSPPEAKRVLLTFNQPKIPHMLLKRKTFLRAFQITPVRVFRDMTVRPLFHQSSSNPLHLTIDKQPDTDSVAISNKSSTFSEAREE
ncbi:uncharacterized protein LOC128345197 isoform X7 [Hemicordylus capensis]|uniref:uncharacterized protein LOC128345197 isoform X7 n=1 Tax=Hemicordylus capensis TaxID=884348 RepID=UPI0023025845|nr:uncharacterized protein LOC128345197 isoform X7 [Hemicordylus capensis]